MTTSLGSPTNNIDTKTRKKYKIIRYGLVIIILFSLLLTYATRFARSSAQMVQCYANIYYIAFVLGNYLDLHGSYPQYQSEDGTPLWSWRVVLYESQFTVKSPDQGFHKDEPWNSDHNFQVVVQSNNDRSFVCPCRIHKDKRATYVAVTGPGTAWTEISNGNVKHPKETCRDMILFIETNEPKNHWAEPGDDVSPDEVIRLFQADPGLVKNSKSWSIVRGKHDSEPVFFCTEGHWPKFFATVGGGYGLFSEIKSVEELRKRLIVPDEFLINKPILEKYEEQRVERVERGGE